VSWPEVSIEDFPPERDDEPSSLRQDILDELTDHFVCALNRELLKNPNEQFARQSVLNQFGDPIKIARQLWFDAMKEKMMSQRIMTGVSVVLAVCCIAVVGIAWSMMKESQEINKNLAAQLAAIADRPEPVAAMNQDREILKQLDELKRGQTAQADSSSQEMNPIFFQLVQEGEDGKPAIGFKGTLTKYEGRKHIFTVNAVADKTGLLDFGKLPWGKYSVNFSAPWGESTPQFEITTIPGRKYEASIVCPANAPEDVAVQFKVDWQNMPTGENSYLLCDFRLRFSDQSRKTKQYSLSSTQIIHGRSWSYLHDLSQESGKNVYLIDVKNNRATPCALAADGSIENMDVNKLVWSPTVGILQGQYGAPTIYLIQKNELSKLANINSMLSTNTTEFIHDSFRLATYPIPFAGIIVSPFKKLEIAPELVVEKTPTELKQVHGFLKFPHTDAYTATKNQSNVWEIKIPDLNPITRESGSLSSVP